MTDLRQAAQQALEALWQGVKLLNYRGGTVECLPLHDAITALRDALAQQAEPVEPVAWRITDGEGDWDYRTELPEDWSIQWSARYGRKYEPLYTAPPQRKPLMQEQLYALYDEHATHQEEGSAMSGWFDFARAVERAHGIGDNT